MTAGALDKPHVLVIAGPTASGKSQLALDIADALADAALGEIVNADASQVYRELAILSARPGPADLARRPHHLYGVLPASERCSAGRWRTMALAAIADIHARNGLPILVGGTGLYIRALMRGLADIPPVPDATRASIEARLAAQGPAALHAELAARDPETAARLAPADRQRILRALAVLEATGRPISAWQRQQCRTPPPFAVMAWVVEPPRDALRDACAARFRAMMAAGAIEEVRALMALGLDPALPALKALGVRELARRRGRGHASICQTTADLVPDPVAGGRKAASRAGLRAIFGKNLSRLLHENSSFFVDPLTPTH